MNARLESRFRWTLGALLLVGLALRLAYVAMQAQADPWFARPVGDAADTINWAREILAGESVREGAFYGPPLYPYLLAGFMKPFGLNFGLLYYLQHLLIVGAAGFFALAGRRLMDATSGLAAAAVFLLYGPSLFFASRPTAEPLALFLFALAVYGASFASSRAAGATGIVAGLATVARPTLLPLVPLWAATRVRREGWQAALLLCGFVLALVPTTWRNHRVSGHVVPVSSNAGLTFYHGNGPGATGWIEVTPELHQSGKGDQRDLMTRVARERSGQTLDAVEADRYWGREGLKLRLSKPLDTARLLLRKILLTVGRAELSLDMAPRQDANPLRWVAPLPFAVLFGLAAAAVTLRGLRGTGGWTVWGAVLACAATPLLFYVTSRYRLPLASALCLPAGAGLAALLGAGAVTRSRHLGWIVAGVATLGSLIVPYGDLLARSDAVGLRQRAWAWRQVGDPERAVKDLERSVELYPAEAFTWVQLGDLALRGGRPVEAETHLRTALAVQPGYAPAACLLGGSLVVQGRDAEAVPVLRQGIANNPLQMACWNELVAVLVRLGRPEEAAREVERARSHGVPFDARILTELERALAGDAGDAASGEGSSGGEYD